MAENRKTRRVNEHTYPDKILPTVVSDMWCYFKHGYTFAEYCDRNTHGRNYGNELRPIWDEEKAKYDEQKRSEEHAVSGTEDHEGHRKESHRR